MNYGKKATMQLLRKYDNKSSKVKNKFKLIVLKILLVVVIVAGAAGISSGIGVMKGIIDSAPDISKIDVTPTGYSTTVLAANGEETATLVGQGANRQYVTIDEIPLDLQHAFVAIEDERFYDHNGIDLHGIGRAFISGLSKGRFSEGASTITQQLIKNNVLTSWTSETSFVEKLQRKIQEQYLALELEKQVNDKDWILENYMNSVNLGANTLGVQAASKKYFNKDVSELTLSEASVIAGITQNPSGYNPITHPDKNANENSENTQEYYYDAADGYGGNHAPVSTITVKWDDNDSPERKMERLIVQKWIALFPDGQEGWNEIRRTGYPCVFPVAQSTNGYDLDVPNRIPFDPREMNGNNQENYRKAVEMLGGKDDYAARMWWQNGGNK